MACVYGGTANFRSSSSFAWLEGQSRNDAGFQIINIGELFFLPVVIEISSLNHVNYLFSLYETRRILVFRLKLHVDTFYSIFFLNLNKEFWEKKIGFPGPFSYFSCLSSQCFFDQITYTMLVITTYAGVNYYNSIKSMCVSPLMKLHSRNVEHMVIVNT